MRFDIKEGVNGFMRFKRSFALTAMLIVLALVVAACGGGKKDDDTTASNGANNGQVATNDAGAAGSNGNDTAASAGSNETAAQTITIPMEAMAYNPKDVTIPPGTTVRFVNNDAMAHDVVQGTADELQSFVTGGGFEPAFQSPVLNGGDAWEITFDEEGEFAYGCTQGWHFMAGMVGTITVQAGAEVPQELI